MTATTPPNGPAAQESRTILPGRKQPPAAVRLDQDPASRYQPVERLGAGATGEVTLVRDQNIDRMVAMKTAKRAITDPTTAARFVEEARTIGQLDHPNIAPVHDVGIDAHGRYYFTMKYVRGETLADVIAALAAGDRSYHRRYSFERRTQLIVDCLHAISFAHEQGYVHRDLKPANIMVGAHGEVTVMDWGIAKRIAPANSAPPPAEIPPGTASEAQGLDTRARRLLETGRGKVIGTIAYMAPEQALGQRHTIDQRCDLYSITAVFYELLTLKPYLDLEGRDIKTLIQAVIKEYPRDPYFVRHAAQGAVPRELCAFLRRGLEKDPARRFQTAQEMIDQLQSNLEGKICVVCPSTFVKRGCHEYGHFIDRNGPFAVVLAVIAASLAAFGLYRIVELLAG